MRKLLVFMMSINFFPVLAFSQSTSSSNQPNTSTNAIPTLPSTSPSATPSARPSGSPVPSQGYVILFRPELSKILAESVHLGPPAEKKLENGCTITGASDGAMTCILKDSCNAVPVPICGVTFIGTAGLSLSDLVTLNTAQTPPSAEHLESLINQLRS